MSAENIDTVMMGFIRRDAVIIKNEAYNQALDDVWKKAISKYDDCLDLGELREIVEELKR